MKSVFFFKAEDGIRDDLVTGVQTCAFPISSAITFVGTCQIAERQEETSTIDSKPIEGERGWLAINAKMHSSYSCHRHCFIRVHSHLLAYLLNICVDLYNKAQRGIVRKVAQALKISLLLLV